MPKITKSRLCSHCDRVKPHVRCGLCIKCRLKYETSETKKCSKCKTIKNWKEFSKRNGALFNRKPLCKTCASTDEFERVKSKESFLKSMLERCRSHNIARNKTDPTRLLKFTWTYDQMLAKLEELEDKCDYTGLPMNYQAYSNWQCSPERIDNTIGYVASNMTFVVLELQLGNKLQGSKDLVDFICTEDLQDHPRLKEIESGIFEDERWIKRCDCGMSMNSCKSCTASYHKFRYNTIKGRLTRLVYDAKKSTLRRNKNGRMHVESEIKYDDAVNMLKEQKGRCLISNKHLSFKSGEFNCVSLERKNTKIGYTLENCCLIMVCLNTIDRSCRNTRATPESGSGGWSVEKINFLRAHHKLSIK